MKMMMKTTAATKANNGNVIVKQEATQPRQSQWRRDRYCLQWTHDSPWGDRVAVRNTRPGGRPALVAAWMLPGGLAAGGGAQSPAAASEYSKEPRDSEGVA